MKDKSKDKRDLSDRRKIKSKNHKDSKRDEIRRGEDRQNNLVYYLALFSAFTVLASFFIISYIHG